MALSDKYTPTFPTSEWGLEKMIIDTACFEGTLPPYDNNPWEAFDRAYEATDDATRARVDLAFINLLKARDVIDPRVLSECLRRVGDDSDHLF